MTRRLRTSSAVALSLGVLLLSGCGAADTAADPAASAAPGSPSSAAPSETAPGETAPGETVTSKAAPSATPAPAGRTVAVTIKGDQVTPNGERVKASVGEQVTFEVTSDRAGELHVHASPEQELAYDKGSTTLGVTVDRPGIVDVEDHVADVVVVQLEVS